MPPKMNQVWKALQEKMSNKRAQQGTRPRKGAKGTATPSDVIVQRLTAEPDNKQTFRPVQPREFVEFSNDDLTLENLKIACAKYFGYPVGLCDVLVSNKGPSCTNINEIPHRKDKVSSSSRFLRELLTAWSRFDRYNTYSRARKNPRPGYENDGPVHWLMMNNELFPLCFPLMPTIGTLWLSYPADIKYRPNNPDVSGASNYLS